MERVRVTQSSDSPLGISCAYGIYQLLLLHIFSDDRRLHWYARPKVSRFLVLLFSKYVFYCGQSDLSSLFKVLPRLLKPLGLSLGFWI